GIQSRHESTIVHRRLLRWPILRIMVPVDRHTRTARLHAFSLTVCVVIVALVGAWAGSMLAIHMTLASGSPIFDILRYALMSLFLVLPIGAILTCMAIVQMTPKDTPIIHRGAPAPIHRGWRQIIVVASAGTLFAALVYFIVFNINTLMVPSRL